MAKLGIIAIILAVTLAGQVHAAGPGQSPRIGLFGTVTEVSGNHPRAVAGETDITLKTESGLVEFSATEATTVRMPGRDGSSVEDLAPGDHVAVLVSDGRAISILVKPSRPVRSRHFTGVVTSVVEDWGLTIRDGQGRQISATALTGLETIRPGELVTAVLDQDPESGTLLITALQPALKTLGRIRAALEQAEDSNEESKLAALRQRLADHSSRHLTVLGRLSQQASPTEQAQLQQALQAARDTYGESLRRFNAGPISAQVSGLVTSIDQDLRRITVQPKGLPAVEVAVSRETGINFRGRSIGFSQLDLASRVIVRYDLENRSASQIQVLPGETLSRQSARALLSLLSIDDPGEITGAVTGLDLAATGPQRITIQDSATGSTVVLTLSEKSLILGAGRPTSVGRDFLDQQVTAIFDPASLELAELDTLVETTGRKFVSGIVHSFVSKVATGNLSIMTREGQIQTFSRTEDTVIRRDGRQVSINEVRLGDRVRANSRYFPDSIGAPALDLLSLRSPNPAPIRGIIRGVILPRKDGQPVQVTVLTSKLEIVTLTIDGDTQLNQLNQAPGFKLQAGPDGIVEGLRIKNGFYDPISGRALRLFLEPTHISQTRGEITAIGRDDRAITITTRSGETVRLMFPDSRPPKISRRGQRGLRLQDLQVGDRVRVAIYDPSTKRAHRLVLGAERSAISGQAES
ncbi:MAG: hypothetical protein IIB29_02205 [Chloroflexi bacterium]|nr:hypothetical protein [Chloroflexota bacterium]